MRRSDRLYALVDLLRARSPRPVSRAELAERLEVTLRTVERDILALQQAGVPIWSQRGRTGGYAIDPQWSLPPLNFDATEALAVIAALASVRSMPFAEAGRRAQAKVLAAMSAGEAAQAKALAGRLRIGELRPAAAAKIMRAVESAVVRRDVVEIEYLDRRGAVTSRPVEAQGLHLSGEHAYLIGWCRLRQDGRAFRLDRITSILPTGEAAPPRDIDPLVGWLEEAVTPDPDAGNEVSMSPGQGRSSRRSGPPRRAERCTGSSPLFVRAVSLSLPGVTEATRRVGRTFSVSEETFLVIEPDGSVRIRNTDGPEQILLPSHVGRDELRVRIEDAWAGFASVSQRRTRNSRERKRMALSAMTPDDIRGVVLALPGVVEGPIWGQEPGFLIGTEKKTRFARFGPPEGARVGNLLPPDDADTLVILHCPQKPTLLASCPERYFTTPHYGPLDEPGGVITRLAENRGPAELQELGELLEDAWREVASPDLIAAHEAERSRRRVRPTR